MFHRWVSPPSGRSRPSSTGYGGSTHPTTPSPAKMLRQLEPLRLVVRADAFAIELRRPRQHLLVDQPPNRLAVLEDERHLARAHFEHGARAAPAGAGVAEARIEEAGVVHAELAHQRIERHHLGRVIGRHLQPRSRGSSGHYSMAKMSAIHRSSRNINGTFTRQMEYS